MDVARSAPQGDTCRSRCEDNNVSFMRVQPHYYRVWQVVPCHRLGEVAWRFPWATEMLSASDRRGTDFRGMTAQVQPHLIGQSSRAMSLEHLLCNDLMTINQVE